jgi:hypothetical protein
LSTAKAWHQARLRLDYTGLNELAKWLGRPVKSLIWQYDTDPFYAESPARLAWAQWFADLWERFGFQHGVHLRRIHYRLVSQDEPILDANGRPYVNHINCWSDLKSASRDARYLDLVPIDAFIDQRADEAVIYLVNSEQHAELSIDEVNEANPPSLLRVSGFLPEPPEYQFTPAKVDQRYHVEIWAEKTTVSDILVPLAQEFGLNLVMGAGDLSLTHCHQFIERVVASGRPARILYVSDFDPAGRNMPIPVARKIDFLIRRRRLELDIQLRPVALTHEQCVEHQLPRTPLKDTAHGKDRFEERFGTGATELDALEALHPGLLESILREEIERYHDTGLDDAVEEVADEFMERLERTREEILDRYDAELEAARGERHALADQCNAELDPIIEKYEAKFTENADSYNAILGTVATGMGREAPHLDEIEWPEPTEGDEDDNPLFDSTRDYVEQMDRLNEYQERPTEWKIRSDAGIAKGKRRQSCME